MPANGLVIPTQLRVPSFTDSDADEESDSDWPAHIPRPARPTKTTRREPPMKDKRLERRDSSNEALSARACDTPIDEEITGCTAAGAAAATAATAPSPLWSDAPSRSQFSVMLGQQAPSTPVAATPAVAEEEDLFACASATATDMLDTRTGSFGVGTTQQLLDRARSGRPLAPEDIVRHDDDPPLAITAPNATLMMRRHVSFAPDAQLAQVAPASVGDDNSVITIDSMTSLGGMDGALSDAAVRRDEQQNCLSFLDGGETNDDDNDADSGNHVPDEFRRHRDERLAAIQEGHGHDDGAFGLAESDAADAAADAGIEGNQPSDHTKSSASATKGRSRFGRWYHVGSFNVMMSFVLNYFSNVLLNNELQCLARINAASTEPKDLLLRLASRKPTWYCCNKLLASYGEKLRVEESLSALVEQALLAQLTVDDVVTILRDHPPGRPTKLHRDPSSVPVVVSAQDVIGFSTAAEAREIATAIRDAVRTTEIEHYRIELKARREGAASGTGLPAFPPANVTEQDVQRLFPVALLPTTKESLWNYILSMCFPVAAANEEGGSEDGATPQRDAPNPHSACPSLRTSRVALATLKNLWREMIGDVYCIDPTVRSTLALCFKLFHVVSGFSPSTSGTGVGGSDAPLPTTSIILSTLGVVVFPSVALGHLPMTPLEEDAMDRPRACVPRLNLFRSRGLLDCFLRALDAEVQLFELLDAPAAPGVNAERRQAARQAEFVRVLERRVLDGLLELADASAAARLEARAGQKRKRNAVSDEDSGEKAFLGESTRFLEDLFVAEVDPLRYSHLHRFLPLCQWLRVVERVVELCEGAKLLDRAGVWLRVLLHANVHPHAQYPLRSNTADEEWLPHVPIFGFPRIPYRFNKRGEWEYRHVLDLAARKAEDRALDRAESVHAWHANPDAADMKRAELHAEATLWLKGPGGRRSPLQSWTPAMLDHHIARVAECLGFCRRAHRLSIERTLIRLSIPPRRWKGPPAGLLGAALQHPVETFVHARREAGGWVEAKGASAPLRPEEYVLRWVLHGRGRKEQGWRGVHCEGSWASSLFAIILHDVLYDDIAAHNATELAWLTPFQSAPLDFHHPSFWRRNAARIEATLDHFAECPRAEFVAHCRRVVTELGIECAVAGADGDDHDGVAGVDAEDADMTLLPTQLQVGIRSDAELHGASAAELGSDDESNAHGTRRPGRPSRTNSLGGQRTDGTSNDQGVEILKKISTTATLVHAKIPLLGIAQCVPQRPLCQLFRALGGSALREGHMLRFSGFPDLVLWRVHDAAPVPPHSGLPRIKCRRFVLSEVKSPNDTISEKQLEKCDLLLRCGFEVELAHIVDVSAPKQTKLLKQKTAAFTRQLTPRTRWRSTPQEGLNPIVPMTVDDD